MALPTRLVSTCCTRIGSPFSASGTNPSVTNPKSKPLPSARSANISITVATAPRNENSNCSKERRPASIFEKSRISLIKPNRKSAWPRTVSTLSRCSADSGLSNSNCVIPITAFIGVRISWLTLARNSLFSRDASKASSRVRSNCVAWSSRRCRVSSKSRMWSRNRSSVSFMAVTSVTVPSTCNTRPASSFTARAWSKTTSKVPSCRRNATS